MNKEKQIEDMARKICPIIYGHNDCKSCDLYEHESCLPFNIARKLTNNDYRKASEVAREIFDKIYDSIKAEKFHHKDFGDLVYLADIDRIIAELKKKYTEGEE